jgi:hypothetical protein
MAVSGEKHSSVGMALRNIFATVDSKSAAETHDQFVRLAVTISRLDTELVAPERYMI